MFDVLKQIPFHPVDWIIILLYFVSVLAVGWYWGRREDNAGGMLVGGRSVPWYAVLISLVATEVSAVTFLGTPGAGFNGNFNYLQFGIGSILGRIFIAVLFIRAYYSEKYFSIYEFLSDRYGYSTKYTAILYFLVTRLMASGVRLLIASLGVSVILGIKLEICIILFALIAIIYTGSGGIRAVIWTDMIQAFAFIGAGLVVCSFIIYQIGWDSIIDLAHSDQKFQIFRFYPEDNIDNKYSILKWLLDPHTLFIAVLNGLFVTSAALGTDHDLSQRILSAKNKSQAALSMILSGFISIPLACFFLFIGTGLFAFFTINGDTSLPTMMVDGKSIVDGDQVFPYFIREYLPWGLKGIALMGVIAAAMSSLDSAMAALGASVVAVIYKPESVSDPGKERDYLFVTRVFTVMFGIILGVFAYTIRDAKELLWFGFQIVSLTYGGLLGVFLLATLTKRGTDRGNVIAMLSGTAIIAFLFYMIKVQDLQLAWSWLIVIGTTWTFIVGALFDEA
jgi:SSS family transporter